MERPFLIKNGRSCLGLQNQGSGTWQGTGNMLEMERAFLNSSGLQALELPFLGWNWQLLLCGTAVLLDVERPFLALCDCNSWFVLNFGLQLSCLLWLLLHSSMWSWKLDFGSKMPLHACFSSKMLINLSLLGFPQFVPAIVKSLA
jgi:hypothetical protein